MTEEEQMAGPPAAGEPAPQPQQPAPPPPQPAPQPMAAPPPQPMQQAPPPMQPAPQPAPPPKKGKGMMIGVVVIVVVIVVVLLVVVLMMGGGSGTNEFTAAEWNTEAGSGMVLENFPNLSNGDTVAIKGSITNITTQEIDNVDLKGLSGIMDLSAFAEGDSVTITFDIIGASALGISIETINYSNIIVTATTE